MSSDQDPKFFSILPDEIVEQILKDATGFSREFKIPHPDDGDPLFTSFVNPQSSVYSSRDETEWHKSLPTRRSLVLVSKRFLKIATPILYSSVFSHSLLRLELLWRTLQEKANLCLLKRIAVGFLEDTATAHNCVIGCCPNLIIVESLTPVDLGCLPLGLLSLRLCLNFTDSNVPPPTIYQLARLKKLELLQLRSSKYLFSPNGDLERFNNPSSYEPFHPSLRTVAISEGVPETLRNNILHPGASIQNIIIKANDMGPYFYDNILPRIRGVTHLLLLSQSNYATRGEFNPIYTLPRLQHIDLEALWETRGFDTVDLISLESVVSFSFGLKWFPSQEMVYGLKNIIKKRLAPKLRTIYTTQKYLNDVSHFRLKVVIKELIEVLEGVGVEWLVECDDTFRPMQSLLKEQESYNFGDRVMRNIS